MNRRSILSLTAFLAVTAATPILHAQTVTVAKTGGTFSTVQAALDSFVGDSNPAPNVVQITDNGVYDEMVTIQTPVSIHGNSGSRATIALQGNPQSTGLDGATVNIGLVVKLPSMYSTGTVELKNLNLIPSKTNTPTGQGIRIIGVNLFMHMNEVTITANNGNDQPVTLDGRNLADLSSAVFFGDDGMFMSSTVGGGHLGDGLEVLLRNTVISHNKGATTPDGIVVSGTETGSTYRSLTLGDGCVISYNGRYGLQINRNFTIDAPSKPVLIANNTRGIWFAGDSANDRVINGLHCLLNTSYGISFDFNNITKKITFKRMIVANNAFDAFYVNKDISAGIDIINSTIIGTTNRKPLLITSANTGAVNITNSIIGGTGDTGATNNTFDFSGTGGLTLNGVGIIGSGPQALYQTTNSGSGSVTGTATVVDDPQFVETTDFNSPNYFNVANSTYGNAGVGGSALGGGAKYVGTSGVNDWTVY